MPLDLPLSSPGELDLTAEGEGGVVVRRSVLPGGIRVLSERLPGLRSVSVGAWVGVGSRDETDGHFGSTHFLEHLLFKGTARRNAMEIAESFDAVGGEANAATGKEQTCYYARVRDGDLPMAVEVIGDMVTSALLDPGEMELERGVILEELAMNDDDPSDVVHEQFAGAVFGAHPLGRPIAGTPATIRAVPRDAVAEHYRQHYRSPALVVTAAGGVDHDRLCEHVLASARAGGWDLGAAAVPVARRVGGQGDLIPADGTELAVHRATEQANVIVGCTGPSATEERRFALSVLTTVLGGGMSSRLFQEVRERRGLAYSVYAFSSGHAEVGLFGLYAGCTPARVDEVSGLLHAALESVASSGITTAELERAVGQLSGNLVLGLEDPASRMNRLGKAELVQGELLTQTESLERIRAVTGAEVQELAADLAGRPRSEVRVGPFGG